MTTDVRDWSSDRDTAAMQRLASRSWPHALHPGGLGWSKATGQLGEQIVVVDGADGEVDGWASVEQPDGLALHAAPDRPDIASALLQWLLRTARGSVLSIDVFDDRVRDLVTRAGFEPATPPFGFYRMNPPGLSAATGVVTGPLPPGYTIRGVGPDEAQARVAVHRAAWKPVDLPFAAEYRPDLDESWASSFSLEQYHRVQSTYLYDASFDLVVVAPDGALAGCCIGWFDAATGWTEIEPLGVAPGHRRLGLAGALCAAVATRTASAGGHYVFINTGASDSYPGPYNAYLAAGFSPFVPGSTLTRQQV